MCSNAADALRCAKANDRYVVYEVDGRGRVTEVTDRKQYFKVKASYDENNREIKRILGNGNKQDYTYDEAGRLLGIVETDSNRAIIWAECYGYDGEGRRIFTADERGNLTRYVYDEQYRIKEVQYPASEELRAYHREEAKEVRLFIDEGAASHRREIMNPVELAQISATFSRLVGARTSNLGSMVGSTQLVWSEQYTYDANGNIATKTTPYGTIRYSYDKENRLLTRGAVHYTYDEEGNLLTEEQSDYYLKRYEYAGFNRMEMSDIITYRDNTHVITDYRYDSFGRRIHTAERTKTGMRTIYDGLTFEVVKEAETFLGTRGITSSATGEANLNNYTPQVPQNGVPNNTAPSYGSDHTKGTRYYYIPNNAQGSQAQQNGDRNTTAPSYGSDHTKGTRYYHIPNNAQGAQAPHSAIPADRTKGVRTYLYLNGERVAINNLYNTNHGQYYYGSDILGSVKFVTGQGGQELKRIEYDAFGGIYKGNSPYGLETGYTGKPYDSVTELSDYGFRDYSPKYARFITEDPIRDGENWFAYVGNNPVNWIDPWGLEAGNCSDTKKQYDKLLSYGITFKTSGYAKHPGTPNSSGQNLYLNKPQDACFLRCYFEANVLRETGFTVHYVKLNNILHQESTFHIAPYVNIGDNSYVIDPLFGGHNGVMNVYTWEKQFQPEKVQFMKGYDETGKPTPNIEVGNSYQYAASKNNKFKAMSIDQFAGYWLNSYGTNGNIKKIEEELK